MFVPACTVHWLDGGKCPDVLKEKNIPERFKAVMFDGEKGQLVADYDYFALYPEEEFKSYQAPVHAPAAAGTESVQNVTSLTLRSGSRVNLCTE